MLYCQICYIALRIFQSLYLSRRPVGNILPPVVMPPASYGIDVPQAALSEAIEGLKDPFWMDLLDDEGHLLNDGLASLLP